MEFIVTRHREFNWTVDWLNRFIGDPLRSSPADSWRQRVAREKQLFVSFAPFCISNEFLQLNANCGRQSERSMHALQKQTADDLRKAAIHCLERINNSIARRLTNWWRTVKVKWIESSRRTCSAQLNYRNDYLIKRRLAIRCSSGWCHRRRFIVSLLMIQLNGRICISLTFSAVIPHTLNAARCLRSNDSFMKSNRKANRRQNFARDERQASNESWRDLFPESSWHVRCPKPTSLLTQCDVCLDRTRDKAMWQVNDRNNN